MLTKRIIPIVQVRNYQIVKSRRFGDYRVFGNFEQTVAVYNGRRVDELVIVDIDASKTEAKPDTRILKFLSRDLDIPLTYGGGVTDLTDIENCLANGCDRIALNNITLSSLDMVAKAVAVFGSQCIVGSVDYSYVDGVPMVFSHVENEPIAKSLETHLEDLQNVGIGELLLTSVDHDGMMNGYDSRLKDFVGSVTSPILINGGCGTPEHIAEVAPDYAGCCMSSLFQYSQYGYRDIKDFLRDKGIPVR
tara:strand:- start:421 stop:1164 length:744 start_codon:yes stop_codon:yes gene_type:complete